MKTLKDKKIIINYQQAKKEVLNYSDYKEAVTDFNKFFKTILKENSIFGLDDNDREIISNIMQKYDIEPVDRNIGDYKYIMYVHKKIFGDFEK